MENQSIRSVSCRDANPVQWEPEREPNHNTRVVELTVAVHPEG